jgi:hypothetical protein
MSGATSQRATALLLALALCWPMATALAAAATSPDRPACCMRMSHACHSQEQQGDKFQSVCRACGWCHAVSNARAHLNTTTVIFSISIVHAGAVHESQPQTSLAVSRLHASRAPPSYVSATQLS